MNITFVNKYFFWLILLAFLSIGLVGIVTHEIWLDEAHHWLIAKDSSSVKNLYHNMRYDGHPILWNILLFFISRLTDNIFWMQLLNLIISSAAICIFISYSPFSNLHKGLFVFGYFILYEYTVISRNYSLILLFAFVCVALYTNRKKYSFFFGVFIVFLANTHLFGLIISGGLTLVWVLDFICNQPKTKSSIANISLIMAIVVAGVMVSILQIIPPADTKLVHNFGVPSLTDAGKSISFFLKGFLPIPDISKYHFWNTSIIANTSRSLGGLISLGLFFIPILILREKVLSIVFFYCCAIFLMIFFSVSGMAASRYFGIIYIVFILSYWLAQHEKSSNLFKIFNFDVQWHKKITYKLITILFVIQSLISIPFYYFDITSPFSEAKATINYLRKENLDKELIVVDNCLCTTLSAYLNKQLYYLSFNSLGSYCPWNNNSVVENNDEILKKLKLLKSKRHSGFVFIHTQPLILPANESSIILLHSFTKGMVESENYYIYRVTCLDQI